MIIKTKYNVDDTIYTIRDNAIVRVKIYDIQFKNMEISYNLEHAFYKTEDEVFSSLQEIVEYYEKYFKEA